MPPAVMVREGVMEAGKGASPAVRHGPLHRMERRSDPKGPSRWQGAKRRSEGRGVGEGSSGGRARVWKVSLAEGYMGVGTEVGILTSVASHLMVVLEISKIQVWKLASRFGT